MMPIITLLTDFGLQDSYVAEMKGAILDAVPDVTLVDVTHSVPPGTFSPDNTCWRARGAAFRQARRISWSSIPVSAPSDAPLR